MLCVNLLEFRHLTVISLSERGSITETRLSADCFTCRFHMSVYITCLIAPAANDELS